MHKITAKQCRTARSLLKWNIYDLANHIKNIQAKRIDSFEHGAVYFLDWEHEEIIRGFKKAGIIFRSDLEVLLDIKEREPEIKTIVTQGEGAKIVLDVNQNVISDSSLKKTPPPTGTELFEEEKANLLNILKSK